MIDIFFSPDILRTSKNHLPKICNTPSKSCSRLSCICGTTLFLNTEKTLLGEIYCRSLAWSRNVIEKIPTQAWKTGETVGNRIFNGPCKVMLVAGSFSCPSLLPSSQLFPLYCDQALPLQSALTLTLPKCSFKWVFTSQFSKALLWKQFTPSRSIFRSHEKCQVASSGGKF